MSNSTHERGIRRRPFLRSTGVAFGALIASGCRARTQAAVGTETGFAYGPLVDDPEEFLDLPRDFRNRVLSRLGDPMDDGLTVPDKADGQWLFVNAYSPARTLAITGPWHRFRVV